MASGAATAPAGEQEAAPPPPPADPPPPPPHPAPPRPRLPLPGGHAAAPAGEQEAAPPPPPADPPPPPPHPAPPRPHLPLPGGHADGDRVAMGHAVAASADEEAPPPSATTSNPSLPSRPRHCPRGAAAVLVQRARSGHVRQAVQPGAASPLGGQAPHPDAQKESTGMDLSTRFMIEVKLLGNLKTRRSDCKYWCFDMEVDSDTSNFMDLHSSVVDKYPPAYLDVAHFQYYDEELKSFPEVKNDQDLMVMFERHSKKKFIIMFVVYRAPSDPYEPVTEWDFSEVAKGTRGENNEEDGNSEEEDGNYEEEDDSSEEDGDDDEYLMNPKPQNEHVGVDEEAMYLDNVQPKALQVVPAEKGPSYEGGDDSQDEDEGEGGDEDEEEQCNEDQSYAPSAGWWCRLVVAGGGWWALGWWWLVVQAASGVLALRQPAPASPSSSAEQVFM